MVVTCWLPNARELGERVTAEVVPVPLRLTVCGLPAALSAIVSVALLVPVAVGVKATLTVQLPLGATAEPQPVRAKSPLLVPDTVRLLMPRGAAPTLVTVTLWGALAMPTAWLEKFSDAGDTVTVVGKRILVTKASESPPP